MVTAGVVSLLFKILKQPVVLGYIVAGMMVGPYLLGESWLTDVESVENWGNIGVLFVLFSLGLEFSVKKLIQVGSTALIGAGTIVVGMMSAGFATGMLFGWDFMNSIFLGGMLCMSSTTIVFKAIEEAGLSQHKFVKVCFGILIVEDLFAVVLMVLLSSIAVKNSFEGEEMLRQVLMLVGYLLLWFVCGITLIPTLMKRCKPYLNDETMTILSIGLCLGMVVAAVNAGFSSALGAFVMGSILAETIEAERIEHLVTPMKNVFGSIFFVSVGMLIDPAMLIQYWLPIVIISLVVILGQIFFASLGSLLSGQSLRVSLQTGFSLVQIGEFAFIIATLGSSLGVTDPSLYPIVVAVSVLTTFLTPYIMRMSLPTLNFLEAHMTPQTKQVLDSYSSMLNKPNSADTGTIRQTISNVVSFLLFIIRHTPVVRKLFRQFNENLYAREAYAASQRSLTSDVEKILLSLDIHISEFDVPAESSFAGMRLKNLNLRKDTGINLVRIVRGGMNINIPGGEHRIFPGDRIIVAGTDEQMELFRKALEDSKTRTEEVVYEQTASSQIVLENFIIEPGCPLVGKSILESHVRDKAQCIVMSIVRPNEDIFLNPDPNTTFVEGDIVIVAGEQPRIREFVVNWS